MGRIRNHLHQIIDLRTGRPLEIYNNLGAGALGSAQSQPNPSQPQLQPTHAQSPLRWRNIT